MTSDAISAGMSAPAAAAHTFDIPGAPPRSASGYSPDRQASGLTQAGIAHLEAGNAGLARDALERALLLTPHDALAWACLARACAEERHAVYAEAAALASLRIEPQQPDALLTLGILYLEAGRPQEAIDRLKAARAVAPSNPHVLFQLARALEAGGDAAGAMVAYRLCMDAEPAHPDAHNNLGLLVMNEGRPAEALESFARALAALPDFPEAWYNRGLAYRQLNQLDAARDAYQKALSLRPHYPDALNNLANLCLCEGREDEAESWFKHAIAVAPRFALAYQNYAAFLLNSARHEELERLFARAGQAGVETSPLRRLRAELALERKQFTAAEAVLSGALQDPARFPEEVELLSRTMHEQGQHGRAIEILRVLIDAVPATAARLNTVGALHVEQKDYDEALVWIDRALELDSEFEPAVSNKAMVLRKLERWTEAEAVLRAALARREDVNLASSLGSILHLQRRVDEAREYMEQLVARFPAMPELRSNLGTLYIDLGDFGSAQAQFEEALRLNPKLSIAAWNLAFVHLGRGELERGWELYEKRLDPDMPEHVNCRTIKTSLPMWEGEPLAGKRLLVLGEQGYGDQIQCLRFGSILAQRGAQVGMLVRPGLTRIAHTANGVVAAGDKQNSADYDLAVYSMSLPRLLHIRLETIPADTPYLRAEPAEVAKWRARLARYPKTRATVGLVWNGNPEHPNDRFRSLPLNDALALLRPDVTWIGLNQAVAEDVVTDQGIVHPLASECGDFADTAALIESLDLVITVDTAVAHLTGALHKPCWTLLAANPDWRWLQNRDDSPWYPSLRLFRQRTLGDWSDVIANVNAALQAWLERPRAGQGR